jgi:hypothetical protein
MRNNPGDGTHVLSGECLFAAAAVAGELGSVEGGPERRHGAPAGRKKKQHSAEEKEQEKENLMQLVKDFAKEVVPGKKVQLVDPHARLKEQRPPRPPSVLGIDEQSGANPHEAIFSMDRNIERCTLQKSSDGPIYVYHHPQSFPLADLRRICKRDELLSEARKKQWGVLGSDGAVAFLRKCLMLELQGSTTLGYETVLLHFEGKQELDRWATCLQVFRMSLEIGKENGRRMRV